MSWAIVTGASSGIGFATAQKLAQKGYNIYLIGRREDRLRDLAKKLPTQSKVFTLDVRDAKQIEDFIKAESTHLPNVKILVNNAGLAKGADPVQTSEIEDWDTMIDTNVKGLLYFTRAVLPYFLRNKDGHIVNLGSVAGRWVYPGGAVYCATKYAVAAFSEGLRMDLMGSGIRVSNIEPGMVETEFSVVRFEDEDKAKKVYEKMKPLSADDIADCILWCLDRPAHVNIQELVVFPTDQAAIRMIHRS